MHVLITGGCGFIGTNAALYFHRLGFGVTLLDNLSRPGSEQNAQHILRQTNGQVHNAGADLRNRRQVAYVMEHVCPDAVLHLGAQVAVTTSLEDPVLDFETNALGTLNLIEAMRRYAPEALLINASTNKVYGKLAVPLREEAIAHVADAPFQNGIAADQPMDCATPYGCSKGAAEIYVRDAARVWGMRTLTLRQSCIYGPHQHGMEDQGWLAWFMIAHANRQPVTIYGDGKQVRDVLHVQDLCELYTRIFLTPQAMDGRSFNAGGGPANTLSLLHLARLIGQMTGREMALRFADWRPGDQRWYVSDIRPLQALFGWNPKIAPVNGIRTLMDWVHETKAGARP